MSGRSAFDEGSFAMGSFLYKAVDRTIVFLCLPFYAVAIPLMRLSQWFERRRPVRLGMEVTHWPACDVRTDFLCDSEKRLNPEFSSLRCDDRPARLPGDLVPEPSETTA